jgi:hypothetical protein
MAVVGNWVGGKRASVNRSRQNSRNVDDDEKLTRNPSSLYSTPVSPD